MANEKRLIPESERVDLIRCLKRLHDVQFTPGVYEHSVIGRAALFLEETADAVEVVRCKGCKHRTYDGDGKPYCLRLEMYLNKELDFFCSYGERKDNS